MDPAVLVSRHPLVLHKLSRLRDRDSPPPLFRDLVRELSRLLFIEAAADLQLRPVQVLTPLGPCDAQEISERISLVPILRAGLGMAEAILDFIPDACVWHLGLYR